MSDDGAAGLAAHPGGAGQSDGAERDLSNDASAAALRQTLRLLTVHAHKAQHEEGRRTPA